MQLQQRQKYEEVAFGGVIPEWKWNQTGQKATKLIEATR
jgi:hypothetical protein